jgi:hypothetical protein
VRIADGKHFLKLYVMNGELRGEVHCVADPEHNDDAECRADTRRPECLIKYAWSNLGIDMLTTPHHAIERVLVWTSPLPIAYESEGAGEDYTDYVVPDLDHASSPAEMRELAKAIVTEVKP